MKKMQTIDTKQFTSYHNSILFQRLKLNSYMLILVYPCFFIVDFFFFPNLKHTTFLFTLSSIHLTGLIISVIFLLIDRIKPMKSKNIIIHVYLFLYLIIGAISSINSQLFNGNIYAYIIIILGVAVIFPIRPRNLFFHLLGVHLFFIIGLILIEHNYFSFLSKMINSTGAAVIAYMIALALYTYQKNDFLNQQKLTKDEESFRRLFNLNPNPLILITRDLNEILLVNHAANEYYHWKNIDKIDASILFTSLQEKRDIIKALEEQNSIKNYVSEQQVTSKQKKWSMLSFELVDYLDETCILMGATDITDLKEKENELYQQASFDILTGVLNRRSGMDILNGLIAGGPDSEEFIICYIDINNLKIVNDRFGHSIGDELIKTCCDFINLHIDDDDVLFRLGGDEFIIVFLHKKMESVMEILDVINQEFHDFSKHKPYPISVSHGNYQYKPGTNTTIEEILEWADQEMYKNKFLHKTLEHHLQNNPV